MNNNDKVKGLSLHEKLSDTKLSFGAKLKMAVREGYLDYWWERVDPPNESPEVFRKFISKLKGEIKVKFVERKSDAGPHGLLGESECFKFEHGVSFFGEEKKYFIKGYFFNKGDLKGVVIQSFREIPRLQLM